MALRVVGNRSLKTLPGAHTRPTAARVRSAVFNIWQGEWEGCHWLDLCAGTGAMGAEALGRGAARVVGVEQWGKACQVIQDNWRRVAQAHQSFEVIRGTLPQALDGLAGQDFDYIYLDPPYGSDCYDPTLGAIVRYRLLKPGGSLAVEHDPRRILPDWDSLERARTKVYGQTALTFYTGI